MALSGATVSVIAGDLTRLGGASAAVGGGGGPSPRKRKFVHRVGDRLYLTDSAEEAERQAAQDEAEDAEQTAQRVIAKAKKKPVRESARFVEIPDEGVSLQSIRDMAIERARAQQFDQMAKRAQYDRIVALYARMVQDQDDEDVLLLMMV